MAGDRNMSFLDSKRIVGTNTQRTGADAISGGWKEVGRTTLGSSGDTISVGSLSDKRYYMVLGDIKPSGNVYTRTWLNGDTGTNYSTRYSGNGDADATITSTNDTVTNKGTDTTPYFTVQYFANLSSKEKLWINHSAEQQTAGAGTAPERMESVNKWSNTSNPISTIQQTNEASGDLASDTELVVLGYDPDDTHTDNFWEELASVELTSAGDSISSGTFTAKKYLWIQGYVKASGAIQGKIRVGNGTIDTGSNYADRNSVDGGSDGTNTSGTAIGVGGGGSTGGEFFNCFIINNASNEKLFIIHSVKQNTSGAGTAPRRKEVVGKWSNTSNQINIVEYLQSEAGSFDTGSFIKVWGSN